MDFISLYFTEAFALLLDPNIPILVKILQVLTLASISFALFGVVMVFFHSGKLAHHRYLYTEDGEKRYRGE